MRALCIGDLHLGAGADLGREPGERLAEQSAVLERAVEIANELEVDAFFWLGDAWERRRPTPAELDAFQNPLAKLKGPLLVVPGNHDVEGIGRITGYDVALFGRGGVMLAHEPSVWRVGDADVAVLPWTPRSAFVAREGGGDVDEINRQIAGKLLDVARGLYASCDAGRRAVLLAHWSVGGASTDTGMPTDLFREPVIDAGQLLAIGFDAIVLGHIHRPQTLFNDSTACPVLYVGSPMPLNFGEATGEERGAVLLDIPEERGAYASAYRIPIESRKLVTLRPDLHDGPGGVTPLIPTMDLTGAIVKAQIRATEEQARGLDVPALRDSLLALGAHKVWAIQVEVERAETVRGPRMDETVDDLDAMRLYLEAIGETISPLDGGPLPEREAEVIEAHTAYMEEANR